MQMHDPLRKTGHDGRAFWREAEADDKSSRLPSSIDISTAEEAWCTIGSMSLSLEQVCKSSGRKESPNVGVNPLRAIFHMAAFIGTGAPVFDLSDHAGEENDLLISDGERGRALAEAFKDTDIVLMRGHGSTVVGTSVQHAVFRAVYAELNARYQLQASSMGKIKYLSPGECRTCVGSIESQIKRPWDFWCEEATTRRER